MFSAPCGSGEGAGGWGVSGDIWGHGSVPTCMDMHTHVCTCMHTHVYMYRNCKWPPTWRHPCLSCLPCLTCMCMCACVHVCACMCAWNTPTQPYTHSHPIHPSATPRGDPQNQLKFDNTWTNQDISIPFTDLKSVKNSPPMGGCMVFVWVGSWVGSGQNTKNFKDVDWIKIIQFCLQIYDL